MDLHVDADANLAEVSDSAAEAAREALTNRMHVALARPPRAQLHYRELRLRRVAAVEPSEAARPAPPAPEALDQSPDAAVGAAVPSREPLDEPAPSGFLLAEPPTSNQPATEVAAVEKKDE